MDEKKDHAKYSHSNWNEGDAIEDGQQQKRIERNVNSDIYGSDEGVIQEQREKIVEQIRIFYCIIEQRANRGETVNPEDIVEDFRKVLSEEKEMRKIVERAKGDFPLRRDLMTVGREFKDDFRYVLSAKGNEKVTDDARLSGLTGRTLDRSVAEYVFELTETLRREGRVSQARNFNSLMSSLRDFMRVDDSESAGGKKLLFGDIDAKFVREYAEWLKGKGIIASTQSFYLRTLRMMLNKAQESRLIKVGADWFKDVNTRIYIAEDVADRALSREVLLKIEGIDLSDDEKLMLVRDMFMFGFYCEGMELVDVANLTEANIRGGKLVYNRRQRGLERSIILGKEAQRIIGKYSRRGDNAYLFPLLDDVGPITFGAVSNYVRTCLASIGRRVGFPRLTFSMNITTYKAFMTRVNMSELLLKHGNVV